MTETLLSDPPAKELIEVWSPDTGSETEVHEMVELLRSNNFEVSVVRLRDLHSPELHVGVDEFLGMQGVRQYLEDLSQPGD